MSSARIPRKRYVVTGINALGRREVKEFAYSDGQCAEKVQKVAARLVGDWDVFTIEVEAEDYHDEQRPR